MIVNYYVIVCVCVEYGRALWVQVPCAELSEFSLPKQYSRNSIPPVSYIKGA